MDLELISNNKEGAELYLTQMEARLKRYITSIGPRKHMEQKPPRRKSPIFVKWIYSRPEALYHFFGIPEIPSLELKLYWANLFVWSKNEFTGPIVQRRRLPMSWLMECCENTLKKFEVACIADIPHPEFPQKGLNWPLARKAITKTWLRVLYCSIKKKNPKQVKGKNKLHQVRWAAGKGIHLSQHPLLSATSIRK